MATRAVRVTKSLQQEDLQRRREHCSADAHALSALGITVCQQVRVKRSESKYALYTVSEVRHEDTEEFVRMGLRGRKRLLADDEDDVGFDAEFDSQVVDPTMSDEKAEQNGEFIERLHDDGAHTGLIVIAPHGGKIEEHTDDQAQRVFRLLDKAVSFWLCKGYHPLSAFDAWHITAVDIHPASFPLLNSVFSRRFTHAVAFHGFAPDQEDQVDVDVLVGGMASRDLKQRIASEIAGLNISVRVAGPDDLNGGDDRCNLVNRLTIGGANGIQIEQKTTAKEAHWDKIAEAVANVYQSRMP